MRDIQHVGSTAVEGLVAKPIIDIAIGINDYKENITEIVSVFDPLYPYTHFLQKHLQFR